MNPATTKQHIVKPARGSKARIAAAFYLLTILTGIAVLVVGRRLGFYAIAAAFYIAVTALFYVLTRGA